MPMAKTGLEPPQQRTAAQLDQLRCDSLELRAHQEKLRTEEELSAPLAQSPEQRPHDWHEELRRARNMDDDVGFLNFRDAWGAVRQLAQTNDAIDKENRINSLWRMYPKAAEDLGLPKPPASSLSQFTGAETG